MPQLEFATYASQIFWLIVTFGFLYFVMSSRALPVVREVLHNRNTRISEDLKKAEKLKEDAESAEADFTSLISTARNKALDIITEARKHANDNAEEHHAKLDETFARQAQESEYRLQVLKKEVSEQMSPIMVDVSRSMVQKLIGVDIDRQDVESAVLEWAGDNN